MIKWYDSSLIITNSHSNRYHSGVKYVPFVSEDSLQLENKSSEASNSFSASIAISIRKSRVSIQGLSPEYGGVHQM